MTSIRGRVGLQAMGSRGKAGGLAPSPAGSRGKRRTRYQKVLHENDPCFEPAFALYEKAFPPEERSSREAFVRVMKAKRLGRLAPSSFHFIVALIGGRVVGMGSGRYLATSNIGYIAYLVVDPEFGGRRLGPNIRNHLITAFRHDALLSGRENLRAIVGEVEEKNRWLRILAGRGQVLVLDLDYEQPSLKPDLERVPLMLYYQPTGAVPASLPVEDVLEIVRSLYREVYLMDRPEDRAVYRDLVKRLEGRKRVGHRSLKPVRPRDR